jgi:ABC-2 type transport system ATP-binding protein
MLTFFQVEKSYGSKRVLDIPAFELAAGVYWLQGSNGTGKTTLLRMLAGIVPFRGEIRLQRLSLRSDPVRYRRAIGWADAEPVYPDFLTGADLLAFYRGILHPPPGQVEELIEELGVASWLDSRAATWSSGMCKKVSLLLAFLGRPGLILLDEPLVTLDSVGVASLYALVAKRWETDGTSFILSSHQSLPQSALPGLRTLEISNIAIELK